MKSKHLQLPFGADRDSLIRDWFKAQRAAIGLDFDQSLIYIAASDSRARWVQQMLAGSLGAVPETAFGTIDGVVSRLASRVKLPGTLASAAIAREHLRAVAMHVLAQEGSKRVRPSRLWMEQISAALNRIAVAFAPEHRDAQLQRLEIEAKRAGDSALESRLIFLRAVQEQFRQRLEGAKLVLEVDLEWLYLPRLGELLKDVRACFVDDVYRLAPAQRAFLAACAKHTSLELVLLSRSSKSDEPEEAATLSVRKWIEGIAPPNKLSAPTLQVVEPSIALGLTQRQEARHIVRRVKRLHLDGVALADIGVCMVTHDQQKSVIHELEFNGVPVRTQMDEALSRSPLVDGVLSLLRALANGAERERLLAALRSPWLRGLAERVAPFFAEAKFKPSWPEFVDRFAILARKSLVVAGIAGQRLETSWLTRLQECREKITKAATPEELKQLRRDGLSEGDLAYLEAGKALLASLDELLRAPRQDLVKRVVAFVEDLEIGKFLPKILYRAGLPAENQRRFHAISLDQLLSTLLSFQRVEAIFGNDEMTALGALVEDIEDELAALSLRPRKDVEGVYVGGLLDAREVGFPHLLLGGLYDGEVPFSTTENLYLPSRVREICGHLGESEREALGGEASPQAIYRHLFHSASRTPRASLHLTLPHEVDGGEVEPSLPLREYLFANGQDPRALLETLAKEGAPKEALGDADGQELVAQSLGQSLSAIVSNDAAYAAPWVASALRGAGVNLQRDDVNLLASANEGRLEGESRELAQRFKKEGEIPFISTSSLESYAACPIRYFFREVLGLEEEERPSDEISPIDKGSLIHNALENFFLEVRAVIHASSDGVYLDASQVEAPGNVDLAKLPLLDLTLFESLSGKAPRDALRRAFAEEAKKYPFPATNWRQWLARIDDSLSANPQTISELSIFLRHELEAQSRGVLPWLAEYSFGNPDEPESGPSHVIRDSTDQARMQIRGYIDRVDVLVGDGGGPLGFVVRDYKVSKSSKKSELQKGLRFQLPIYAAVVGDHFSGLANLGFFYHLITPENAFKLDAATMSKETGAQIDGSMRKHRLDPASLSPSVIAERLSAIDDAMGKGLFHPSLVAGEGSCKYCRFSRICAKRPLKLLAHQESAEFLARDGAYVPALLASADASSAQGDENDDE